MALQYLSGGRIQGLSSDTKPTTNIPFGTRFEEIDTRKIYTWLEPSGVIIDGSYTVLRFKANGTFTPAGTFNVDYLIVGGGGGGGSSYGGGGGAGDFRPASSQSVSAQAYPIVVGVGGLSGSGTAYGGDNTGNGAQGGSSSFNGISSFNGSLFFDGSSFYINSSFFEGSLFFEGSSDLSDSLFSTSSSD